MRRLVASRGLSLRCGIDNPCAWRATGRWPTGFGNGGVQSSREIGEGGSGTVPAQLLYIVEEHDVGPERSEPAKKQHAVQSAEESVCEGTRIGGVHPPLQPVRGNGYEMGKLGKNGSRRFRTPALQSRI